MKATDILLCIACPTLSSIGQVLLRGAALTAAERSRQGIYSWLTPVTASAIIIYGTALILWMYTLTRIPISKAFSFFGLSFFLVPMLGNLLYKDPIQSGTWIGATLILLGVICSSLIK